MDEDRPQEPTRREVGKALLTASAALGLSGCAGTVLDSVCANSGAGAGTPAAGPKLDHTVVVIGTGFRGTMTALSLARSFKRRGKRETILMLERGTWWTTPLGTVQDPGVRTATFLEKRKRPYQYWSSIDHFKGLVDLTLRCVRRKGNEDGLYDITKFGRGSKDDGVTVLRASGVGGGSLVYANVTIQPPDFIFQDQRWPGMWASDKAKRDEYYELAREAIGKGVLHALDVRDKAPNPARPGNTGLSKIVTRTGRISPQFVEVVDPGTGRKVSRIDVAKAATPAEPWTAHWLPRARVFQTTMAELTSEFGTVDSSINDLPIEPKPFEPRSRPLFWTRRSSPQASG